MHNVQKIQEKTQINVNTWAILENGEFCVLFLQLFYKSSNFKEKGKNVETFQKSTAKRGALGKARGASGVTLGS